MKGASLRDVGVWRAGLVGLLLPIALGSAAQTPPQSQAATATTKLVPTQLAAAAAAPAPTPVRTQGLVPNPTPVADGFDVRQFEDMAQQLVADQRIPGM